MSVDTECDSFSPEDNQDRFDELGADGWELVSAAPENSINDDGETYTEYIHFFFKREIF